jgi:hypothetical protein
MKIFNVRLGLATNSSSSHSLIFLKDGIEAYDYFGYRHNIFDDGFREETMGDFGWGHFICASREAKLTYLGVLLRDRLHHSLPANIAKIICDKWLDGIEVPTNGYIDHQSWYFLPSAFGTNLPDEDFFNALKSYFLDDQLVVLGGNDNIQALHPLDDGSSFHLPLPRDCGHRSKYTCRYDQNEDFWTLFNEEDGRKVRFRLDKNPNRMSVTPQRASTPELVDIKITNYCPFGCEFCYQSSTTKGKHAEYYEIYRLAHDLAELKVFEVAIGGGEPTMHPDFSRILEVFREVGIVPNFTTKNPHWLRDPQKWPFIIEKCGAFAYSVNDEKQIHELATLLRYNGIDSKKANIHIVMGTVDRYQFDRMLEACGQEQLSVTLLGYKRFGFGLEFEHKPYPWWIEVVKKRIEDEDYHSRPRVAVDTVLAKEFEKEILEAGVPNWMFDTEDGKFSCYIDAVEGAIGPSSYCEADKMQTFADLRDEDHVENCELIRDAFAEF